MSGQDESKRADPPADWDGGWEANERERLLMVLEATPAQRLAWLEEAIEFAWKCGALPAKNDE